MADRLPQYSMISNFSTGLNLPQHVSQPLQQPQHPQVQQQPDTHQLAGFSDQARLWQVQQTQSQFRPPGGPEMGAVAPNPQMADLLRVQNMARMQGQQLGQPQRPFQMGTNPMQGLNSAGGLPSQPVFHDQNNQQHPSQPQPHMSPGFTNMGMNPNLQSRPGMMGGFQNANTARQLEFMNLVSQNPHNGMNFPRMNSQPAMQNGIPGQQQVNPSSHDVFSSGLPASDALRRPSPSHNAIPAMGMNNMTTMQVDPQENAKRIATLREGITSHEATIRALEGTGVNDHRLLKEQRELSVKRQYLAHLLGQSAPQSNAAWPSQMGQGPRPPFNNPAMGRTPQPPQHPSIRQPNVINPAMGVPQSRQVSGPLPPGQPSQQMNGGIGNTMSTPNMGQPFPFSIQGNMSSNPMNSVQQAPMPQVNQAPSQQGQPQMMVPPQPSQATLQQLAHQEPFQQRPPIRPLDRDRFTAMYRNFCQANPVQLDTTLMSLDGRPIDLHTLHVYVLQEGGYDKVNSKEENWNIIGGKMGFVNFPGTETEPARSGPGVAQRLAQVYKECLYQFEQAYTRGVNKPSAAQLYLQFARFANVPSHRLREQGANEKLVQWIDSNRPILLRVWMQQQQQRLQQDPSMQGMRPNGVPAQPGGIKPNPGMGPNFNMTAQQQGAAGGSRPSFPPGASPGMQMQQRPIHSGNPALQGMIVPPTNEQLQSTNRFIMAVKAELTVSLNNKAFSGVEVLPEQQVEYNGLLEKAYQLSQELDTKLPMIGAAMKHEDQLRQIIFMVVTIAHQRHLVSSSNPRYFLNLERLRQMHTQLFAIASRMRNMVRPPMSGIVSQQQAPQLHPQMLSQGVVRHPAIPVQGQTPPQAQASPNAPPIQHPHLSSPSSQPVSAGDRPMVSLRPPVPRNTKANPNPVASGPVPGAVVSAAAVSTPTPPPAPSASTPVPTASTPSQSAASPQAPKSPKTKGQATPKLKPKSQPRRPPRAQPATEPVQSPSASGSVKRQREEEGAVFSATSPATGSAPANGPSPPKKVKTEWEGQPPSGEETTPADEVKTQEQANQFLEQMTELIKMASSNAPESLANDISGALDQILTSYSGSADPSDGLNGLPSLGVDSGASGQDASSASSNVADEFTQFFDFSSLEEDDLSIKPVGNASSASKAPTPELVGPSSAPTSSPESVSEAESSYHPHASSSTIATNVTSQSTSKTEDISEYLRLGFWKEPDGGESAYFQTTDFKWDSPVTQQEQPWAMFPSS
ncbi:hypothetical protein AX16_001925 [Volvariella volvacea WC 439]|nr:hypothetical protein AX16_001925 [Volvariella volvacea WC 439]